MDADKIRVCYYLPKHVCDWIDEAARKAGMNKSGFISSFINEYESMKNELSKLRAEAVRVHQLNDELNEKLSSAYWSQTKNERGAGRKPKLTDDLIAQIKALSNGKLTQREIANIFNISLGLVNKAVNARI